MLRCQTWPTGLSKLLRRVVRASTTALAFRYHSIMSHEAQLILIDQIEPLIRTIRGQNVLLDTDLAFLYGVPTKVLNQAVKRNRKRFPDDFMFRRARDELNSL